jgi:hypothetical protein
VSAVTSVRRLAEDLALDASTTSFQPSALDVLDWVREGDLRFASFLPDKRLDPRLGQLEQLLLPIGDRR